MPAANHGERIGAGKIRRARQFADRFFPRVDQVRIFRAFDRKRAYAQHPVLGLKNHVHARRNIIGNQRRQPDAKVDVESVAQFAGNALDDAFAFVEVFRGFG